MKDLRLAVPLLLVALLLVAFGCVPVKSNNGKKTIVVTYSVLGAVVKDLVGDHANVVVSIPNGLDPHEWEPSARDIERLNNASLVVQNGLGLEAGMQKALAAARQRGVPSFIASDHVTVRHVGQGEGIPTGDPDQAIGAPDPHIWTDPLTVKSVVDALALQVTATLNIDVMARASDLDSRLEALNAEVAGMVAQVPAVQRKLVTGHESMGYFAQRYQFKLVGVVVPSLTSQAETSAADLAALKKVIIAEGVKSIFTELGTSPAVVKAIGDETGARVVELGTHSMPPDNSYFTFMRNLASTITDALK